MKPNSIVLSLLVLNLFTIGGMVLDYSGTVVSMPAMYLYGVFVGVVTTTVFIRGVW